MISVVFLCSSPFVGYTLRLADYKNKKMVKCSGEQMTQLGYKLFGVSGTYSILMDIEKRRYFHTRQYQSELLDEQGRRIYTNIAFIGAAKDTHDNQVINRIAAYEFFETETFYQTIAAMITLTDTGFEVDFEKLESYLTQFDRGIRCRTNSKKASELYREITQGTSGKTIEFVVLEATWEYFVKQAECDFKNSVNRCFTLAEAKIMAESAGIEFTQEGQAAEEACTMEEEKPLVKLPVKPPAHAIAAVRPENQDTDREKDTLISELNCKLHNTETELKKYRVFASYFKRCVIISAIAGAVLASVIVWLIMM